MLPIPRHLLKIKEVGWIAYEGRAVSMAFLLLCLT